MDKISADHFNSLKLPGSWKFQFDMSIGFVITKKRLQLQLVSSSSSHGSNGLVGFVSNYKNRKHSISTENGAQFVLQNIVFLIKY